MSDYRRKRAEQLEELAATTEKAEDSFGRIEADCALIQEAFYSQRAILRKLAALERQQITDPPDENGGALPGGQGAEDIQSMDEKALFLHKPWSGSSADLDATLTLVFTPPAGGWRPKGPRLLARLTYDDGAALSKTIARVVYRNNKVVLVSELAGAEKRRDATLDQLGVMTSDKIRLDLATYWPEGEAVLSVGVLGDVMAHGLTVPIAPFTVKNRITAQVGYDPIDDEHLPNTGMVVHSFDLEVA